MQSRSAREKQAGPTQGPALPSWQSFSGTPGDQDWFLIMSCLVFEESAIHYKLNICSCLSVAWREFHVIDKAHS